MTELAAINALANLTTVSLQIITTLNQAAKAINDRHVRGGEFTPEEQKAADDAVSLSKALRDSAISNLA